MKYIGSFGPLQSTAGTKYDQLLDRYTLLDTKLSNGQLWNDEFYEPSHLSHAYFDSLSHGYGHVATRHRWYHQH